jgi:RND family efflux transporter MFP subunit
MKQKTMGLLTCLLMILILPGCQEEVPKKELVRPVWAMKVGDAASMAGRWFPGRAKATQEVDLAFRVTGPLITRPIDVGDEVKKDQTLARIDPRDFETNLRNVQGHLAQANAALTRTKADFDRVSRIRTQDPGAVSEAMVDREREAVDRSRAEIESLTAAVEAAKDQLTYTYLNAPFDGTVVAIYIENFEYVKARQPIARIIDHSHIEMIVNVPESLITYADDVKKVRIRFDPFPDREFSGQVKEIGREASQKTRTYPVTVIMDQPEDMTILPGMAGQASGQVQRSEESQQQRIEVPIGAVFTPDTEKQNYVWIIDDQSKTASRRAVTTGQLTKTGIIIKDGLKPGQWIALAGVHSLREGQQVRILEQASTEVPK